MCCWCHPCGWSHVYLTLSSRLHFWCHDPELVVFWVFFCQKRHHTACVSRKSYLAIIDFNRTCWCIVSQLAENSAILVKYMGFSQWIKHTVCFNLMTRLGNEAVADKLINHICHSSYPPCWLVKAHPSRILGYQKYLPTSQWETWKQRAFIWYFNSETHISDWEALICTLWPIRLTDNWWTLEANMQYMADKH